MAREELTEEITKVVKDLMAEVCKKVCLDTQRLTNPFGPCQKQPGMTSLKAFEEKKLHVTAACNITEDLGNINVQKINKSVVLSPIKKIPCSTVSTSSVGQFHNQTIVFENDQVTNQCSPLENNPFEECKNMINKLLDTFDTEIDKENSIELTRQRPSAKVSYSMPLERPDASIESASSEISVCQSDARTDSSDHCSFTKKRNDKLFYVCQVPSTSNFTDSGTVFEQMDSEIDHLVDRIIMKNVELLSNSNSRTYRKNRFKSYPSLKLDPPLDCYADQSTPITPECSDNFAELKLNETNMKPDSSIPADFVPSGWLDSLAKRKQRSGFPGWPRTRTRSDDFVYCGPAREKRTNKDNVFPRCNAYIKLRRPEQAGEVPSELLFSGVAFSPGACDKSDIPIVIVLADEIVWQKSNVGAISLARLLLYMTNRLEKITLFLDCRNSTVAILEALLEGLSIFRGNSQVTLNGILLLFSDKYYEEGSTQEILKSLFNCECIILSSINNLTTFVDLSNLPRDYGGLVEFSQAEWAQNRLVVDSFVAFCDNVRQNFARETTTMTSKPLPETARETQNMLRQHSKDMTQLLDDRQITNLQDRSQRILQQLFNDGSTDARLCMELVQTSFSAANDAISCFVRVADDRLVALEQHLLVKQFEQSCDYIDHWYTSNMKILETIFTEMPDSFNELSRQRAEFDAFYINAMTDYAKCDCLLTEVEQLNDIGYLREAELTQRAKITEEQVKELVYKMEKKKEEVEVATQMYKFIDQAYSWALEGMKFVAMLNLSECQSLDSCQKMIEEFDSYMQRHPPIPESEFNEVQNLCQRFDNSKCLGQCEYALQKCKETSELFEKRRELIAKLKNQFKSSSKKRLPSLRLLKNRDKTNSSSPGRPKLSESSSSSTKSNNSSHLGLSPDGISIDELSTSSLETSGFDELSQCTSCSSPTDIFSQLSESDFTPRSSTKPARKVLKKSMSLPNQQIIQQCISSHQLHPRIPGSLKIGSPVQVEDHTQESSGKTKIALIIEELITTEKEYVRSLNYVIEHYFPELSKLEVPQVLRCKRNVIFGNIEKIYQFHACKFLSDLEKCDGNPLLVAKTFQKHKESFGLYALYSKNKPLSDQLLQEHGNEFFKAKQLELGDKMDLASYLLKPVQRMGKYSLLLHNMSKQCTSEEERCLKEAEELVKFQLRHGNDLLTMDSIKGCDVNLKEQGKLIRQDQFVVFTSRRKIMRRVFLFEDLILFSKPIHVHGGHDVYQYKGSYKTADIGLTENIGESGVKFEIWFRRRRSQSSQDTYVLQSATKNIKRTWVDEIRGLLWDQALRNRNRRKEEMSSMGVGSKPHLDLAVSSENRITDRSVVATPPGDRSFFVERFPRGRTRASIAVASFDYASLQSKRPHSTISTSSSTSSVGSGNNQSSSLVSSLSLASWPSKFEVKSFSGFSPPTSYYDFHAIAEDLNEDCETSSESSVSASPDSSVHHEESTDAVCKSPISRQYVTTV